MNPFSVPASVSNFARRITLFLSFAVLLIVIPAGVRAQQRDDVITTDTALVQLNVGVVDKQGNAVTSLSRNDFTIFEDGVRRPIMSFEPTEAPISLKLIIGRRTPSSKIV